MTADTSIYPPEPGYTKRRVIIRDMQNQSQLSGYNSSPQAASHEIICYSCREYRGSPDNVHVTCAAPENRHRKTYLCIFCEHYIRRGNEQ